MEDRHMAFNNAGPPTFIPEGGPPQTWDYSFGGDQGTQFASADIKIPNQGAQLLADRQTKRMDNNGNAIYSVTITNLGPGGTFYNLQGGGMS